MNGAAELNNQVRCTSLSLHRLFSVTPQAAEAATQHNNIPSVPGITQPLRGYQGNSEITWKKGQVTSQDEGGGGGSFD